MYDSLKHNHEYQKRDNTYVIDNALKKLDACSVNIVYLKSWNHKNEIARCRWKYSVNNYLHSHATKICLIFDRYLIMWMISYHLWQYLITIFWRFSSKMFFSLKVKSNSTSSKIYTLGWTWKSQYIPHASPNCFSHGWVYSLNLRAWKVAFIYTLLLCKVWLDLH